MIIKPKSAGEHQQLMASFMPNGRPFLAKSLSQTTLYKLIYGLAVECARVEGVITDIETNHDIRETTLLIDEWEKALGIPDDCFTNTVDLPIRRKQVIAKLASMGVQTAQDFIDLAAVFGYTIQVEAIADYALFPFYTMFPIEIWSDPMTARFTFRIRFIDTSPACIFPFTTLFPICFSSNIFNIVTCLFDKLKPANTDLIYVYPT